MRRHSQLLLGVGLALLALAPASASARGAGGLLRDIPTGTHHAPRAIDHTNLPYGGGPVLHSNRTHVIFWQPSGSGLSFDPGYVTLIERFLSDVAFDSHKPTNVYGLTGQYTDVEGPAAYASTYSGSVLDTDPLPPNGCTEPASGPGWGACVTDAQLQQEIDHVVAADHLPNTYSDVYFLVTPRGFGSCIDGSSTSCALGGSPNGYCGYHDQTDRQVLYAFIPYNAVPGHCQSGNPRPNDSTADPAISTLSHEHNELVTDPYGDAWVDAWGEEDGDLCLTSFGAPLGGSGASRWNEVIGGGHFYLQEEWSNRDGSCQPRAKDTTISARVPRKAQQNRSVKFSAHASNPQAKIVSYRWFFGAGRIGTGSHPTHRFKRPGSFRVVLRVSDSWGNWAYYAKTIQVAHRS